MIKLPALDPVALDVSKIQGIYLVYVWFFWQRSSFTTLYVYFVTLTFNTLTSNESTRLLTTIFLNEGNTYKASFTQEATHVFH